MPLDSQLHGEFYPDKRSLPPLPLRDDHAFSLSRKTAGAYYTPSAVAASLCRWAVRRDDDLMLDPACGDGRFIARHLNSIGVDQDAGAVREAAGLSPHALVYNADFFAWAAETQNRFDCVVGNPPFIRYQRFKGESRQRALALCKKNGATFSGLTSAWAPFLVAAASLLKPGGRAAFVVPAEIGHAPYAAPVLEYFVRNFGLVHVVAIRDKLFPDLSEDCWLLYAQDFGRQTDQIRFTSLESFHPTTEPPPFPLRVSLLEWRQVWKRRLRPLLMPESARHLYEHVSARPDTRRFGDLAKIGIGYVTGANDFFHVRPSEAAEFDLPSEFLHPTVRNGRKLVASVLTKETVKNWLHADEPVLLLNIPKDELTLPESVLRYLNTANADRVRQAYKCRQRDPWYTVPDVKKPHFFLSYLSGRSVALVRNQAGCTCTNALHYVRFNDLQAEFSVVEAWASAFVRLSCEIEGHPLGGGLLKLEPREAAAIVLPAASVRGEISDEIAAAGVLALQSWRHYQPLPRVHD